MFTATEVVRRPSEIDPPKEPNIPRTRSARRCSPGPPLPLDVPLDRPTDGRRLQAAQDDVSGDRRAPHDAHERARAYGLQETRDAFGCPHACWSFASESAKKAGS